MKETGIIYKITSPSGKIYVGSTKDFKKDISERNKGEKSYWYNKEMSCEHKQNMRKGHINSEKSRNLTILDEVTGVYYESLGEACELLNLKKETLRSWLTHSKHTNKTNLVLC